jgi:beta-galactosidase GanA
VKQADLKDVMPSPGGVEVAERWHNAKRLLFVMNHTVNSQVMNLPGKWRNLMDGKPVRDSVSIAARDVLILTAD